MLHIRCNFKKLLLLLLLHCNYIISLFLFLPPNIPREAFLLFLGISPPRETLGQLNPTQKAAAAKEC